MASLSVSLSLVPLSHYNLNHKRLFNIYKKKKERKKPKRIVSFAVVVVNILLLTIINK